MQKGLLQDKHSLFRMNQLQRKYYWNQSILHYFIHYCYGTRDFCGICFSFHVCKPANALKQYFNWRGKKTFPRKKLNNVFHPSFKQFGETLPSYCPLPSPQLPQKADLILKLPFKHPQMFKRNYICGYNVLKSWLYRQRFHLRYHKLFWYKGSQSTSSGVPEQVRDSVALKGGVPGQRRPGPGSEVKTQCSAHPFIQQTRVVSMGARSCWPLRSWGWVQVCFRTGRYVKVSFILLLSSTPETL